MHMHTFMQASDNTICDRRGNAIIHHRKDISCETLLTAISAEGAVLKASSRYVTRRVDGLVVKACSGGAVRGLLKRTLRRNRFRRGWLASLYLEQQGVSVPRAHGLIETERWGFVTASYLVMDYLDQTSNVERFAAEMVQEGATENQIRDFLRDLALAIDTLREVGVFHRDLSGKNILTRDGKTFFFVDLESVVPVKRYTPRMRYKNHVQLYDSFCDFLGDDVLEPFLSLMLPEDQDYATWSKIVRQGQTARRSRQIAAWRKQGRSL
ncbi:MAG TPA: lipopolysaccharide kinase InaA family protein [Candidatus Hydrogenedentes bacterium]|nr:lipopolysaccharide kinase InaA family protein [Candidatus Hydrogenedentota bacterium]HQE82478.1 lipopolysaccharide kinase InaA family protein [Candidatus Hydrogenedentota bacterium]HQH50776.1 lipopolysaccharide kinase InaA family protein [Candidatus Hydrogenedentota bacterium]HQM47714.1 lipopolysaccharide kinase InaA family protein [Candidatus Hydrogenedentota bacterium]